VSCDSLLILVDWDALLIVTLASSIFFVNFCSGFSWIVMLVYKEHAAGGESAIEALVYYLLLLLIIYYLLIRTSYSIARTLISILVERSIMHGAPRV